MKSWQWQQVWDNLTGFGFAEVDFEGNVQRCNQAFGEIIGRDPSLIEGHNVSEITAPEDRHITQQKINTLFNDRHRNFSVQKRYLAPNGKRVWCQVHAALIFAEGGVPSHLFLAIYEIPSGENVAEMTEIKTRLNKQEELVTSLMRIIDSRQGVVLNVSGDQKNQWADRAGRNSIVERATNSATMMMVLAIVLGIVVVGFIVAMLGGSLEFRHGQSDTGVTIERPVENQGGNDGE